MDVWHCENGSLSSETLLDLAEYADFWKSIVRVETAETEGYFQCDDPDVTSADLLEQGTCVLDVQLEQHRLQVHVSWQASTSSDEHVGRLLVPGRTLTLSTSSSPKEDLAELLVLTRRAEDHWIRLCCSVAESWAADFMVRGKRLDLKGEYMQLYRIGMALSDFVHESSKLSGSAIQLLVACGRGDAKERRALNAVTTPWKVPDASVAHMNFSQQAAVQAVFQHHVVCIQGPPGTGKTNVGATIVQAGRAAYPDGSIIGSSQANTGADNLCLRVHHDGLPVLRLADAKQIRISELQEFCVQNIARRNCGYAIDDILSKHCKKKTNKELRKILSEGGLNIFSTLETLYTWCEKNTAVISIIEEAGQASEPACIFAANMCLPDKHLCFLGDHQQLPPHVKSKAARFRGLATSLLERLSLCPGMRSVFLDTQYRMHESICSWPSSQYYGGRLITGVPNEDRPRIGDDAWPVQSNVFAVHLASREQTAGTGYKNEDEAYHILQCIQWILKETDIREKDISVITPYEAQRQTLKDKFARNAWDIEVANVDAFQGREQELVIVSFVRANPSGEVGFVDDQRRCNVMLTRAKRGCIIFGNICTLQWCRQAGLQHLFTDLMQRGALLSDSWQVMHEMPERATGGATEDMRERRAMKQQTAGSFLGHGSTRQQDIGILFATFMERFWKLLDMPIFAVSLTFLLGKEYWCEVKNRGAKDVNDWSVKEYSHLNYFTTVGISVDPGNKVLGLLAYCMFMWATKLEYPMTEGLEVPKCSTCVAVPTLELCMKKLLKGAKTKSLSRFLLCRWVLKYQKYFLRTTSLKHEIAGDLIEALGGLWHPYEPCVKNVVQELLVDHNLDTDAVDDARATLGLLAKGLQSIMYLLQAEDNHGVAAKSLLQRFSVLALVDVQGQQEFLERCQACSWSTAFSHFMKEHSSYNKVKTFASDVAAASSSPASPDSCTSQHTSNKRTRDGNPVSQERGRMEHSLTETQQDLTGAERLPRHPNTVSDGRFAVKLSERAVLCDSCGDYYTGENVGNWFCRKCKPTTVAEAEEAYRQGHWDATWWCLQCFADEWEISTSEVEAYFGFTARTEQRRAWWAKSQQRRPTIVKDGRFKVVRKERFFYCDSCHEHCKKTEDGAFIHGTERILAADRYTKWNDGRWDATWYCRRCLKDTHKMTDQEIETLMDSTRNRSGYQAR